MTFRVFPLDWRGSFEILIEATTTASYSDLTIDDISFNNCGLLHEDADCLDNQLKCYETGKSNLMNRSYDSRAFAHS